MIIQTIKAPTKIMNMDPNIQFELLNMFPSTCSNFWSIHIFKFFFLFYRPFMIPMRKVDEYKALNYMTRKLTMLE